MARQSDRGSWLAGFCGLFGKKPQSRGIVSRRRLMAESLESRMVLSVAPVDESVGPSLADYLAQEHEMGPAAPAEIATSDASSLDDTAALNPIAFLSQDEGEGEGSGQGS